MVEYACKMYYLIFHLCSIAWVISLVFMHSMLPAFLYILRDGFTSPVLQQQNSIMLEFSNPPSNMNVCGKWQECCVCLSAYDDGAELRELPCNHLFHCTCIDRWLLINATCPLCKFNILRSGNHHQEVWTISLLHWLREHQPFHTNHVLCCKYRQSGTCCFLCSEVYISHLTMLGNSLFPWVCIYCVLFLSF